ncbi:Fasciclin-like arabinogalactan family protein [Raphanus sativus]|uniref:Fasciclin-like arabinogalactan protein 20 n=1 Tax=Raphanus sativus TaxID=3726 RepID=A0A6J0NCK9_RAPSA|nr:putative fasciclin-like arabinogalactan protein 20 [Raphanus sativus]KAJ4899249.1 Fasciclin-like arabinogalactan family protein [Raphanus sativus]
MNQFVQFFLSVIVVSTVVSGTVEDTTHEIVDALAYAQFQEWSAVFIETNDKIRGEVLPSTLFIPNSSYSGGEDNHKLAAYHVVSERLEFADLLSKASQSRLPTLLTNYSILVTNNSEFGFAVDGVLITEPDVFVDTYIAIHFIASPLDFETYGHVESKPSGSYSTEWSFFSFMLVTVVARIISEILILSG